MENAASGDTIVVAAGTYHENISMKEAVYLRGAGAKVTAILPLPDKSALVLEGISEAEIDAAVKGVRENETNN